MGFFLETLIGGLMAGMLYSLIALGFVLIFKASGVFNFAQGAMVLFAALAMATERQQHALMGRNLGPEAARGLRLVGAILLLAALAWLVADRGFGLGLVMYSGHTSLAAGCVYCALVMATRRDGRRGRPV